MLKRGKGLVVCYTRGIAESGFGEMGMKIWAKERRRAKKR